MKLLPAGVYVSLGVEKGVGLGGGEKVGGRVGEGGAGA